MNEPFSILYLPAEVARHIYHTGIKDKETVTLVLDALKDPDRAAQQVNANPTVEYKAIALTPFVMAWWIRTLENLPDVVDQVLAAHLRGAFALSLGTARPVDNNWTLVE